MHSLSFSLTLSLSLSVFRRFFLNPPPPLCVQNNSGFKRHISSCETCKSSSSFCSPLHAPTCREIRKYAQLQPMRFTPHPHPLLPKIQAHCVKLTVKLHVSEIKKQNDARFFYRKLMSAPCWFSAEHYISVLHSNAWKRGEEKKTERERDRHAFANIGISEVN